MTSNPNNTRTPGTNRDPGFRTLLNALIASPDGLKVGRGGVPGAVADTLVAAGQATRVGERLFRVDPNEALATVSQLPVRDRVSAAAGDVQLSWLPVGELVAAADNVRGDLGDLEGLAASIVAGGVLQPLLVTPRPDGDGWTIVAGHRRHAAALKAGAELVPCLVRELDDAGRLETMIVENLQREDLSAVEEAHAYQLLRDTGWTQQRIADRVGVNQATVSRRLQLLGLAIDVQQQVAAGEISVEDGQTLAKIDDVEVQRRVAAKVADGRIPSWSSIDREAKTQADAIELATRRADVIARLTGAGTKVVDLPNAPGEWNIPRPAETLQRLGITTAAHRKLDCHSVAVLADATKAPVCTTPSNHPDSAAATSTSAVTKEREAQRRRQERANKLADARRLALRGLLPDRAPRGQFVELVARYVVTFDYLERDAVDVVGALLELDFKADDREPEELVREYAAKGVRETWRAATAIALAEGEAALGHMLRFPDQHHAWRWHDAHTVLHTLQDAGHPLATEERKVLTALDTRLAEQSAATDTP